jgi:hypothetical protein
MWDLHPLVALGLAVVAVIAWLLGNRFINDAARRERDELRRERDALEAQERMWRAQRQSARASTPQEPSASRDLTVAAPPRPPRARRRR